MQVPSFRAHDKLCEIFQAQVFDGRMNGGEDQCFHAALSKFLRKREKESAGGVFNFFACA